MEASISLRLAIFDDSPAAPYSRQSLAHPYCTQGRASAAGRYAHRNLWVEQCEGQGSPEPRLLRIRPRRRKAQLYRCAVMVS